MDARLSDEWWKNAVFYCLDVETFLDGNGDGQGDLAGLAQRIDYLAGIGVTCLWLMPFQPTPNRDDGYDITDYYGVDPRVGTLGDLVVMLRLAHERGMRVLMDLVVNHTSDQHPWFQAARADPSSPYREFYVWRDEEPRSRRPTSCSPMPRQHLGVRRQGRPVVPAPLLLAPARPEHREPRRAGRDPADRRLLAAARGGRLPGGRRPVPRGVGRARARSPRAAQADPRLREPPAGRRRAVG
jgi:hypothetical protein